MCLWKTKNYILAVGKGYNKYKDSRSVSEIATKYILCLLETHCTREESLELDGFSSLHLTRAKSKKTNKVSGGLSVFLKSYLKPGIKFLEHWTNEYIWLKLSKTLFFSNRGYLSLFYL